MAPKKEAQSAEQAELVQELWKLMAASPEGLNFETAQATLKQHSPQEIMAALQRELQLGRMVTLALGGRNDQCIFKPATAAQTARAKMTGEEQLAFDAITQAGNKGIWTKDLRNKTGLPQPKLTKTLKSLEAKGEVKFVRPVNNPSKKVYMLADLEPDKGVTGGAWYDGNHFDAAFVEVLREACLAFIYRCGIGERVTAEEILQQIEQSGLCKQQLTVDDLRAILMTLIYDGQIDEEEGAEDDFQTYYRPAVMQIPERSPLTSIPCGVCPVFNECHEDGVISPQTCVYYTEWLKIEW